MSKMLTEARDAPGVVAKQLLENREIWQALKARLEANPPSFVLTVARGSSDHAATFAKYLIETKLKWVCASAAPSVYTVYNAMPNVRNALVIGLSQSGQSPDIVEVMASCRAQGALTVALVNQVESPLAKAAEFVIPVLAGEERAVAATKSYIGMLSALLQGMAILCQDEALLKHLPTLPLLLEQALSCDWQRLVPVWEEAKATLIIGRGVGLPVAQEAALKLKEVANLHAESFSGAEVLHGPFALVKQGYPSLLLMQQDETFATMLELSKKMLDIKARPILAVVQDRLKFVSKFCDFALPLPKSPHPLFDPLLAIQAFYLLAAKLAYKRGFNPDMPFNLKKVTRTL